MAPPTSNLQPPTSDAARLPPPISYILVQGARQHNLKNIDLSIPRDELVVITGLSGSGKSSLAFDTIYAEGQRRYVESLSAYARQFLGQMNKPDVDYISGLSPAISIDQRGTSHNPRSTVGTVTEIYDYLRLLYARVGQPHCPRCGRRIQQQTSQQIVDAVLEMQPGSRLMVLAPLIKDRKGEHLQVFDDVRKAGFVRVRVNGHVRDVGEDIRLDKYKNHTIDVVVDRLLVPTEAPEEAEAERSRIADSVETALRLGSGVMSVVLVDPEPPTSNLPPPTSEFVFSEHFACVHCNLSLGEIEPRTFSFNNPHGACPTCTGLGSKLEVDPVLVLPNKDLSIEDGAVAAWFRGSFGANGFYRQMLEAVSQHYGFSMRTPVRDLRPEHLDRLLYGSGSERLLLRHHGRHGGRVHEYRMAFEGVIPNLERRYKETESDWIRSEIQTYMASRPCPNCKGARLKPESLAVTIAGTSINDLTALSVEAAAALMQAVEERQPIDLALLNGRPPDPSRHDWREESHQPLTDREFAIARQVLKEICARLGFLSDVGLGYLTLDRAAGTLSGGEAQRIRLATQIGSGLMGVLYILDEPSIGLHARDNSRLIRTLKKLRDLGNTLIVVEHDEATIRSADHIVDIGPGAGEHGGRVVVSGSLDDVLNCPESITGRYLSRQLSIPIPGRRRPGSGNSVRILGARENNLKGIDVEFPLAKLICVTGVSGSGKSSLLTETLYPALAQRLNRSRDRPGTFDRLVGAEHLDKVVDVDQSPIGRTPRSNPATYIGIFTPIRELFASVPDARVRGYRPGRFSFNVRGGRCEACEGDGILKIEMQFLPDVYVACEVCGGSRYNRETLEVRYKGKNIADVLAMTVEEALGFFEAIPGLKNKLQTVFDVGLGYVRLGQSATTLSGGEAQRVKLSTELSRRATGRTIYILDEPTTGLHFHDVGRLLDVLNRLVDAGNTVVVIEHNPDVVKVADWIIDLGPDGGEAGGEVVAVGTPEQVAQDPCSYTGQFLAPLLAGARAEVT